MDLFNKYGFVEQKDFTGFYEQREAVYKEVVQNTLDGVTEELSFFLDIPSPEPTMAEVDGYKAESELNGDSTDGGDGDNTGDTTDEGNTGNEGEDNPEDGEGNSGTQTII